MANVFYLEGLKRLLNGTIDLDTDTIKCALVTASYSPDGDLHDFFNDVTNEVTGTGYTAGGATLSSVTITVDTTNNRVVFDAADTTWPNSTITARAGVVYEDTGNAATSGLICYVDFGSNITSTAATFTIQWHANGIFYIAT